MNLLVEGWSAASLICLAAGVLLGAAAGVLSFGRRGERRAEAFRAVGLSALLALPLCVYGAHALYCLADAPNLYRLAENPALLLDLTYGGFALYGGMAGFVLACAAAAKLTGRRFLSVLDALAPAGLIVIAFVRFAEGAAGQGFSLDVENPALCFFPLSMYDPEWDVWYLALFMLEGAYALGAAAALLGRREAAQGRQASLALLLYAGMQIWFESLRRDNFMRCFGGFVRTMQLISAVIVTGLLLLALARSARRPGQKALALLLHALCLGGVVVLEFAVEYKIAFLASFSMDVLTQPQHYAMCYGGMLLFVLLMTANVLRARSADGSKA